MKKVNNIICAIALFGSTAISLASCGPENPIIVEEFSFTASLDSGKTVIEKGETDSIKIETNGVDDENRSYEYENVTPTIVSVSQEGVIEALKEGQAVIVITETNSLEEYTIKFDVSSESTPAVGGFNFSNAKEIEKRTEILGKLEKYAIDSHLTGITLFENGGYVKYAKRVQIPATDYITGYGWGILSEGSLEGDLSGDTTGQYKDYYHTVQTNNPWNINAWNATGSQISDLYGYITSSYWSTKMNSTKNGYVWYPCLAADTVNGEPNDRPQFVGEKNDLGLYRRWRIYVKTDANMQAQGKSLKFHTANQAFDGTPVTLADYEFAYRLLLTGSSKMSRGAEMAADKTYGIKGAQAYYNRTKNVSDEVAKSTWNNMKKSGDLGFSTSADVEGYTGPEYVEIEIINDIDAFTAMYTLSSNLVCPMSEAFIKSLGNGTISDGVSNFGVEAGTSIPENTIGVGTYYLEKWDANNVCFKLNRDWFECSSTRYLIPGIKIYNYDGAKPSDLFNLFQSGQLDACSVPIDDIKEQIGKVDEIGKTLKTEGDSTFKLNVNSCTQDRWNELFGSKGVIAQNTTIDKDWGGVKPWMSNDAFLQGLYWAIDRETFANNRGVNPSINYFANTYLSDPEAGVSYNSTKEHKKAVANYHSQVPYVDPKDGKTKTKDNYGYDYSKAVECFKTAVNQLRGKGITYGTPEKPTEINIHIRWMYTTDINDYGKEIANYFEKAFNDEAVCGKRVKLVVKQDAVTNWEDVYNKFMMIGQFDLAFGAISGNTYNPLNFLEVLKSDNSSTFTLNWGPDTSKVDQSRPIVYDGKKWSFDGLWECADRGGIVDQGAIVKTVQNRYITSSFDSLENGGQVKVKLDFASGEGVDIVLNKVSVYNMVDGSNVELASGEGYSYNKATGELTINVNSTQGKEIANAMRKVLNREESQKPVQPGETGYVADPFNRMKYGVNFAFEVSYSLRIGSGNPTQSSVLIALTKDDEKKM